MFAEGHDLRLKAFVRFIGLEGKEKLAELLLQNAADGIHYGHGRDYDHLGSEDAVIGCCSQAEKNRQADPRTGQNETPRPTA